jgi:enoyl-CoA hydratase/3-hydroxyacyl-CoA dehydrogenase
MTRRPPKAGTSAGVDEIPKSASFQIDRHRDAVAVHVDFAPNEEDRMSEVRTLAVIGAGNMGSGIAQKMATEGFRVLLVDLSEAQIDRGLAGIKKTLEEGVARKIFREAQVADILGRVKKTVEWSELSQADLVVEAVFEDLAVKRDVFARLAEVTKKDAILATNTSSFYVRDLAAGIPNPERVLGLHYFYHPAKNRLVEIIPTRETSPEAVERAQAIQDALGKTAIVCADAPGFIVNRFFVPWLNEAVRLLEEKVADVPTIEAAAKEAFGAGMGPFELMNVTGIPIALHAATTLGRELGAFYAPAKMLAEQVKLGQPWKLDGAADRARFQPVASRLLGVTFLVASAIVDEKVGTIEDVDIGARVGLRWPLGPFELMNKTGVAEAAKLADAAGRRFSLALRPPLAQRGEPFRFKLVETAVEGRVATITINRPDKLNALNEEVVAQLEAAFDEQARSTAVDGIVITGKGKAFVAGADVSWFVDRIEKKRIGDVAAFTRRGHELLRKFAKTPKVVIAKVDGLSLGGGSELALAADWIVGTRRASFGFPETGIGIYPGLGGTQRLSRRIGVPLAKALIFTGNFIGADAAKTLGIVDRLATHEEVKAAIADLVKKGKPGERRPPQAAPPGFESLARLFPAGASAETILAAKPSTPDDEKTLGRARTKAPIALRIANDLIDGSAKWTIDQGIEQELAHLDEIFGTKDAYVGLSSLGKARPVFTGR